MSTAHGQQHWYPVASSASLLPGRSVDAVWAGGTELVVWRSASGAAQAWDNRCPHRSVRLSIGQVAGERLACAYHGWQFEAGTGACAVLPAHPGQPAPSRIRVKTWRVVETDGMLWVSADGSGPEQPPRANAPGVAGAESPQWRFGRSLGIRRDAAEVGRWLASSGWRGVSAVWHGEHGGWRLRAFVQAGRPDLTIAHCWVAMPAAGAEASPATWRSVHAALRDLRLRVETVSSDASAT